VPLAAEQNKTLAQLEELNSALSSGTFSHVRQLLRTLPPADIAHLLEASPPPTRHVLWQLVKDEDEGEILQDLSDELQSQFLRSMDAEQVAAATEGFLRSMDAEQVAAATEGLEPDDVADILQQLPDTVLREVLKAMDLQDRMRVEQVLTWPDDTAGGMMNTDTITVRARHTMDVVRFVPVIPWMLYCATCAATPKFPR
jgi:magnesium transporter